MASRKYYAYYLRGTEIALIEQDYAYGDGQTLGQPTLDDIGPAGGAQWKSPLTTVTDGIEVEYTYSPSYFINDDTDTVQSTVYTDATGSSIPSILHITIAESKTTTQGNYILIKGSSRWNGLHRVSVTTTGTSIYLDTKYAGPSVTEAFTVYLDISTMSDESDEIDLPPYLSKALVYYVKARLAEDRLELDGKEYFMREFRRMLEKHESSRVWGMRIVGVGPHAIR